MLGIFDQALEEKAKDSPRIWYKYIHYQRYMYYKKELSSDKLIEIVEEALNNFPQNSKLHLQKSQIFSLDVNDHQKQDWHYPKQLRICPPVTATLVHFLSWKKCSSKIC